MRRSEAHRRNPDEAVPLDDALQRIEREAREKAHREAREKAEKAAARDDAAAFADGFGSGDVGDAPELAATAGPDGPRERARRRRERPLP